MDCCVIGIGTFGYNVCRSFVERGHRVLAIDNDINAIESIKEIATCALCVNLFDEKSLQEAGIDGVDIAIVGIGSNFEQALLLSTLLKKKFKIPIVVCRAIGQQHKEILDLVGVDHIVLPEEEAGQNLYTVLKLDNKNFHKITNLFSYTYASHDSWIGKSINQIDAFSHENIFLLGKKEGENIVKISNNYVVDQNDIFIVIGENDILQELVET